MANLYKRVGANLVVIKTKEYPLELKSFKLKRGEVRVYLGVGGNIGDTPRRFSRLFYYLNRQSDIRVLESSIILKNPPFGYLNQNDFYNSILIVATRLNPRELLGRVLNIERIFKRKRSFKDAPRTLDLDILFYGDRVVRYKNLSIPHPSWKERLSVIIPLKYLRRKPRALNKEAYVKRDLCSPYPQRRL